MDRGVLALYCAAWGKWVTAYEKMQEDGFEYVVVSEKGGLYQNPWVGIESSAAKDMVRFANQLGLTPSARGGMKVPGDDKEPSLAEQLFAVINESE